MADFYVREEDGTSHYLLEDGSGALLLEVAPPAEGPIIDLDFSAA